MIAFIVYLLLFLGGIFGMIVMGKKQNEFGMLFIFPTMLGLGLLFFFSVEWADVPSNEHRFALNYAATRSLIESKGFDQQSFIVKNQIYNEIQFIDKTIETNKEKAGNLRNGKRFSKEICQYEPLTPIFNKNEKNDRTLWDSYVN